MSQHEENQNEIDRADQYKTDRLHIDGKKAIEDETFELPNKVYVVVNEKKGCLLEVDKAFVTLKDCQIYMADKLLELEPMLHELFIKDPKNFGHFLKSFWYGNTAEHNYRVEETVKSKIQ
jgi:hypothetical protein